MPPHAYADWKGCLRPRFFYTRCLRGCLRGVPCWMAMLVLNKYLPKQFTVGVLNATLDLAALVLVGVAAFFGSEVVLAPFGSLHVGVGVGSWADGLDAYARPPRSLREPTRWNQDKSPETIYHIHINLYASPAAHTPATNVCRNKLVFNVHIPSHLKNANLPTRLAYAKKI